MDFTRLGKPPGPPKIASLNELFEQLDRRATHNSLRLVQIEALQGLADHVDAKDVLLKISTGSGKTLVGLIYAEYMRRRYPGELSLYVCPTHQLASQVLEGAAAIGVEAETFSPQGPPLMGFQGRTVVVCTYDKLFTALNTFARQNIVPSSIVLDDVHAGIDKVRQKYTVTLPALVYDQIRATFGPICESTDSAIWRGIAKDEPDARYEIPYWIWLPQSENVGRLLEANRQDDALRFDWTNLARYVDCARLCISGSVAELSLPVTAVEEHTAYHGAKHRLFMSASIKDGSSLLKDLELDADALTRIVQPSSDRGAGERMILPVALIDPQLRTAGIARLCADLAKSVNVVVLTSSAKQAQTWQSAGAQLHIGTSVDTEIEQLRTVKRGRYAVFAQRFDGVDLPDDACRVLVIDGIPIGDRLCDLIDNERQKNSPGYNARSINRFEQALGRAVRSSADYAAILLVGHDIATFIGRKDVKDALEAHTREQIELGQQLAEQLRTHAAGSAEAIRTAVDALIHRDSGWKDAHRDRMANIGRTVRSGTELTLLERAALSERQAWQEAKGRNYQGAVDILKRVLAEQALHPLQRAELLFRAAGYLHRMHPASAMDLYQQAFQINNILPRPPEVPERRYTHIRKQSTNLRDYLQQFSTVKAALAELEEVRSSLAYSGEAEAIERALAKLGTMLGATSSRPEKETGRGPDVLWLFDAHGLCIEAKNEKDRPIFKKDAEQLLLSWEWCRTHTDLDDNVCIPVFATNVTEVDRNEDISFGPRLLSEAAALEIVDRFRTVLTSLSFDGPLFNDAAQVDAALRAAKLSGGELVNSLPRLK